MNNEATLCNYFVMIITALALSNIISQNNVQGTSTRVRGQNTIMLHKVYFSNKVSYNKNILPNVVNRRCPNT